MAAAAFSSNAAASKAGAANMAPMTGLAEVSVPLINSMIADAAEVALISALLLTHAGSVPPGVASPELPQPLTTNAAATAESVTITLFFIKFPLPFKLNRINYSTHGVK
jgi:hypothetical protein